MSGIRINGSGNCAFIELPGYSPGQPVTNVCISEISNYTLIDYNGVYGSNVMLKNGKAFNTSAFPQDISHTINVAMRDEGE